MILKKGVYDVCGGECAVCDKRAVKNNRCEMVLTKKKVSTKYVPPDTQLLKLLMASGEETKDVLALSDEELDKLENSLIEKIYGKNYK